MMNTLHRVSLTLGVSLLVSQPASAAPQSAAVQARQAIQAAYNAGNAAAARHDADGALKYLDADFTAISKTGEEADLSVAYPRFRAIIEAAHNYQSRTTIQKLTLQDGGAIVITHDHTSFTLTQRQTGQTVRFVSDETARGFWIKTDQGWREKRSKTLTSRETVNGKQIGANN